nr:MAG TPA: hypothetical protein [Caudoviricetes sp.]
MKHCKIQTFYNTSISRLKIYSACVHSLINKIKGKG